MDTFKQNNYHLFELRKGIILVIRTPQKDRKFRM